jgi:hypothetical protein
MFGDAPFRELCRYLGGTLELGLPTGAQLWGALAGEELIEAL